MSTMEEETPKEPWTRKTPDIKPRIFNVSPANPTIFGEAPIPATGGRNPSEYSRRRRKRILRATERVI